MCRPPKTRLIHHYGCDLGLFCGRHWAGLWLPLSGRKTEMRNFKTPGGSFEFAQKQIAELHRVAVVLQAERTCGRHSRQLGTVDHGFAVKHDR